MQAEGAAPDSWEERDTESGPMEVEGVSAAGEVEGRVEEVSAAMEVEGAGAEPLGAEAPLGAFGSVARIVSLSFAVSLGGIVSVGLRAVAAATGH